MHVCIALHKDLALVKWICEVILWIIYIMVQTIMFLI
jgi:hypothetical protein